MIVVVHRQRKSKSKVLQWPTKNELKKFREIKTGKQVDIGHNAKISIYDAALHKDEEGEVDLLDPEMEFPAKVSATPRQKADKNRRCPRA